jgi:Spy/CpxP family protein refolding chaperone
MIDTQLFHDAILVLAMLIAVALAFTTAMMLAPRSVPKPGQTPHGGNRRDLPQDPQPEPDGIREQIPDDIRELVPDVRELVLH